jgi:hypothetical protein|tara:strand:+ start:366 stop:512 length:147 start_codon:yes stop_codon:yes gene_type:complete
MSRKVFVKLAKAIRKSYTKDDLVAHIIRICNEENERFDEDVFREVAGV